MAAHVDGKAVKTRGAQELDHREEPVPGGLPAMDEGDARTQPTAVGGDEPARQGQPVRRGDRDLLERHAEVRRGELRGTRRRMAGSAAIQDRESIREGKRSGGDRCEDAGATEGRHRRMGRPAGRPVKRGAGSAAGR